MALHVSLAFEGKAREALTFYTGVFGLPMPEIMSYSDMPPDPDWVLPEEAKDWIMYTSIEILGVNVMMSDMPPGMPLTVGKNVGLAIIDADEALLRRLWDALLEGGSVEMELQKTFWSGCYGMLTDKYGIDWQFNLDSEGTPM